VCRTHLLASAPRAHRRQRARPVRSHRGLRTAVGEQPALERAPQHHAHPRRV